MILFVSSKKLTYQGRSNPSCRGSMVTKLLSPLAQLPTKLCQQLILSNLTMRKMSAMKMTQLLMNSWCDAKTSSWIFVKIQLFIHCLLAIKHRNQYQYNEICKNMNIFKSLLRRRCSLLRNIIQVNVEADCQDDNMKCLQIFGQNNNGQSGKRPLRRQHRVRHIKNKK